MSNVVIYATREEITLEAGSPTTVIIDGTLSRALPPGGDPDQVLSKRSGADGDVAWADLSGISVPDAVDVPFAPTDTLEATNVQDAIEEVVAETATATDLDTEASTRAATDIALDDALTAHMADQTTHGVDLSQMETTTGAQAKADAKVADAINNGTTTVAPSQNAVFDALALKQDLDSDLTTIAGLSPTNDDILQRKSGAWTNRTIAQLLTDLGLGALYQPLDSDLTAIAALSTTSFGRSVLALADAAALRTLAELGTIATQAASNVTITGGSVTGITDLTVADGGTGASSAADARTNLGVVASTAFTSYSPSFGNFTLGDGTINVAQYCVIGDLVEVIVKVTLGSTSSMGTNPTVSLPVNAHADYATNNDLFLGVANYRDTGTASYPGMPVWNSASTALLRVVAADQTHARYLNVTATVPFTWSGAAADEFFLHFRYRKA